MQEVRQTVFVRVECYIDEPKAQRDDAYSLVYWKLKHSHNYECQGNSVILARYELPMKNEIGKEIQVSNFIFFEV